MTDTSRDAVERLLENVTPGPWRIKDCAAMGYRCTNYYQEIWNDETDILVTTEVTRAHNDGGAANMRFIAAARDLVPALLARAEAAESKLAKAVEALETIVDNGGAGSYHLARTTLAELTGGKDE